MLAELCHPNIVTVYDVGATENFAFIVMKPLEGIDLEFFLRRATVIGGRSASLGGTPTSLQLG